MQVCSWEFRCRRWSTSGRKPCWEHSANDTHWSRWSTRTPRNRHFGGNHSDLWQSCIEGHPGIAVERVFRSSTARTSYRFSGNWRCWNWKPRRWADNQRHQDVHSFGYLHWTHKAIRIAVLWLVQLNIINKHIMIKIPKYKDLKLQTHSDKGSTYYSPPQMVETHYLPHFRRYSSCP